jgi:hypothetical protein
MLCCVVLGEGRSGWGGGGLDEVVIFVLVRMILIFR